MDTARFPGPANPLRWSKVDEVPAEFLNGVDVAQTSARSHFLLLGARRHMCIGEAFVGMQIKTVVAMFLTEFTYRR
ncbi:uncharacterized protein EV422DRAFT_548688 [Fimicolochytrium jonesii]|uniref:uncharacterized protein n=1 Tax=Fimicolochytrium jonesii TaxID=1396493 RepID=UPI0022FEEF1B|nr:uncharacterized protein EV422DRAFT_548688 [Fimicolochytrium jonesii]KAI8815683.1 hypothetical protein EV422DRAFT_548688 [Fimicolochytrium jonesii]